MPLGHSQSSGFSLLEILVTVVIIGVLAAMASVSYCRRTENEYRRYALSTLQTIWSAEHFYAADHPTLWGTYDQYQPMTVASDWDQDLGIPNPRRVGVPITFTVVTTSPAPAVPPVTQTTEGTLTAAATRDDVSGRVITIDQTGTYITTYWEENAGCL